MGLESDGQPSISLEQVRASSPPPQSQADIQTSQEIANGYAGQFEIAQELSSKPAVHRTLLTERESTRLNQDNERLRTDCRALTDRCNCVVNQYATLMSDYTRLRQSYDTLRASSGLTTILGSVAGMVVGIAGVGIPEPWKSVMLYGGGAAFIISTICALYGLHFGRDKYGPEKPPQIQ